MEKMLGEIMEIKNTMADYKNMLRCVFKVDSVLLDENKKIFVDITSINSHMDDVDGSSQVQVGEVEDIRRMLQDIERLQTWHKEIQRAIEDMAQGDSEGYRRYEA